ncbi:hypothetical protein OJAV_G00212520 [Oryzias javanicus]|uniref:KH domain-containing, RNA-binding, signal transduction-associated protein 1 n=1 Tax=Oryzias javanicus TaxID=123683 RepID=A0A3S2P4G8_ORYJA|nr:hypothetical protein OJAV_G00212520 [Oryzias javanicus]
MEDTKYLPELLAEKDSLDSSFTHAMKLLAAEIDRIQKGESKKEPEKETYLDLFATKSLKLKERVLIPIKQYPRVNFVGKLLGPQGSTIKRLQEETGAKISVLGKGSMRDKNKEEELRKGGEAKYAHLSMELHVFIEVTAPIPEAYMRMAHAMDEVKKFLIPEPGAGVVHPAQEDQGVGECHVAVLEGLCVAEHRVEDSDAALPLEEHQQAGGDFLLLLLEEALLRALDHLLQAPRGCSHLPPCLTSNTRVALQGHKLNPTVMMNIFHMRRVTPSLLMRDMIVITASNLLLQILSIMTMGTVKPRTQDTTPMLKMIGTTRGQALVLEAKPPHRGSNCLCCNSLALSKVGTTVQAQLINSTPEKQALRPWNRLHCIREGARDSKQTAT